MLPFDFDYYLPDTLKEATEIYGSLHKDGKKRIITGRHGDSQHGAG
jgi:hypothetical protein